MSECSKPTKDKATAILEGIYEYWDDYAHRREDEAVALLFDVRGRYDDGDDLRWAGEIVQAAVESTHSDAYVNSRTGRLTEGLTNGVVEDIMRVVRGGERLTPSSIGFIISHWYDMGLSQSDVDLYTTDVDGNFVPDMTPQQLTFAGKVVDETAALWGVYAARYDAQNVNQANEDVGLGLIGDLL